MMVGLISWAIAGCRSGGSMRPKMATSRLPAELNLRGKSEFVLAFAFCTMAGAIIARDRALPQAALTAVTGSVASLPLSFAQFEVTGASLYQFPNWRAVRTG